MINKELDAADKEQEQVLVNSARYYRNIFEVAEVGPQHEGLSEEEVSASLQDPETITLELDTKEGRVELPLFVPLRHNEWLSETFFASRFGEGRPIYYFSDLPGALEDVEAYEAIEWGMRVISERGGVLVTEHLEGGKDPMKGITKILDGGDIEYNYDSLGEDDVTPASEWHFAVDSTPRKEQPKVKKSLTEAYRLGVESGKFPEVDLSGDGTTVLETVNEGDIDRLWELYQGPFEHLASVHPIRSNFSYEEFKYAMASKDVMKVVHLEQGEIVTFCFLQNNLDLCPWINKDFYKDKYPEPYDDGSILYFPGIVTDEAKRGYAYSENVIGMLVDVVYESGSVPTIIYECTDLSRQYIPKIVERFINQSEKFECTTKQVGRHLYQAVELS